MFVKKYTVKLSDTDAGGVLFFANQFRIIHDVYEEFMQKSGFNFYDILNNSDVAIPIVYAEAYYKSPLFVGDLFIIQMSLSQIKKHSFVLNYLFSQKKFLRTKEIGTAQTVHVVIDSSNHKKIIIPQNIKKVLKLLC